MDAGEHVFGEGIEGLLADTIGNAVVGFRKLPANSPDGTTISGDRDGMADSIVEVHALQELNPEGIALLKRYDFLAIYFCTLSFC